MFSFLSQNINRIWASIIINEFVKNNITHFYFSPGMRNAPLVAALCFYKKQYPEIEIITCIDERGASYRALGYSKATGKPCVLLCTSGTALANYYPAVIEAYKTQLPLIIISADRPKEQIYSGDNQTINQNKIFGAYVRGELDLGSPTQEISPRDIATNLTNLIFKAKCIEPGPVHLNCPFREPLEDSLQDIPSDYLAKAQLVITSKLPSTQYLQTQNTIATEELNLFLEKISKVKPGILIIGSLPPSLELNIIRNFIRLLNWPVYLDISSSLKYEFSLAQNAIPTFDHPEVITEILNNPPNTVLHIGGRLTSKHYYNFLKSLSHTELITLNESTEKEDPSHLTNFRLVANIKSTLNVINNWLDGENVLRQTTTYNFENIITKKRNIIDESPLSYPLISKTIIESLPDNEILYIANSTIVRSFDSYSSLEEQKKLLIATNRGVSGIEGLIASSCGFIDACNKDIYLIIGDISLMHDLNSLYFLKGLKNNLKIILINNFGGGIFTLLPISHEEEVLSYITSPHQETFETIASNFHLHYTKVNEVKDLRPSLTDLKNLSTHGIVEIMVNHKENKNVYDILRTIKIS